jgi:hypothetical protein
MGETEVLHCAEEETVRVAQEGGLPGGLRTAEEWAQEGAEGRHCGVTAGGMP